MPSANLQKLLSFWGSLHQLITVEATDRAAIADGVEILKPSSSRIDFTPLKQVYLKLLMKKSLCIHAKTVLCYSMSIPLQHH